MLQSQKRRIIWSFCEVIYSKIQRTFLSQQKYLTHLADRIYNTEKFYYSALRYKIQYGLGTPADRIPVGARFSALVQTGLGAHPASCTMGTVYFPG